MHVEIRKLVKGGNDLSMRQMFVLGECLEKGDQTVKSLFDTGAPGVDKPAISRAVQRLEELGMVVCKPHEDRRMKIVTLTKAGRKFISGVNP